MMVLIRLLNHIRDTFTLSSTEIIHPDTSGTRHEMSVEKYTHPDGREATVTYWDGLPAVVRRSDVDGEITEGS